MLTARGWWFLVTVVLILVIGVIALPQYTVVPAILAVTLLVWFAVEWVLFHTRLNAAVARLRVRRSVVQGGRDVPMVWAGLAFEVRVEVGHDGSLAVPLGAYEDRIPPASELVEGSPAEYVAVGPDRPAVIMYTLRSESAGVLRFEGVRVRVSDLHGFFYHRTFLRDPLEFLVLPPLTDDEGRQRADKRFNTLPPPGVHRIRRPGTGSELLDLRDYRPGDPPKMIAWKPSARRDRLITKEFESDVPVRCVMFLDTSEGMRLGPPGNTPLTRMAKVASGLAQAAAGNRDLVGLTTVDEEAFAGTNPARTKLHLINLMRRLAEVSVLQPPPKGVPPEQITRRAYPLALELYPDLIHKRVNRMPLGRLWIPLLDRKYGGLLLLLMVAGPVVLYFEIYFRISPILVGALHWLRFVLETAASLTPRSWPWSPMSLPWRALFFLFWMWLLLYPPLSFGLLFWFFHGIRGWFGFRRQELTRRKRLAAVLALRDGTGPAGIERLVNDDDAYAERVGRFFQQHQLRCPVPLYDNAGNYRFRCPGKAGVLGHALVRAVSRARDNELYVLLADLTELGSDLAPILKAARMARARHHQVLVIVPWPGDVPPPDAPGEPSHTGTAGKDAPPAGRPPNRIKPKNRNPDRLRLDRLTKAVGTSLTRQYHEKYRLLRRSFGRVGATVVRVNEGDPVQLVLDRLDRLRGMRSRR
jgi:uncharacterized protein (DUF58 family)